MYDVVSDSNWVLLSSVTNLFRNKFTRYSKAYGVDSLGNRKDTLKKVKFHSPSKHEQDFEINEFVSLTNLYLKHYCFQIGIKNYEK